MQPDIGTSASQGGSEKITLAYHTTAPFKCDVISSNFQIDGKQCVGSVIATPGAIYLLVRGTRRYAGILMKDARTAAIPFASTGANVLCAHGVKKCRPEELPEFLFEHSNWPRMSHVIEAVAIEKWGITEMRHPKFSNEVRFTAAGFPFLIEYTLFFGSRVKRILRDQGWTVAW